MCRMLPCSLQACSFPCIKVFSRRDSVIEVAPPLQMMSMSFKLVLMWLILGFVVITAPLMCSVDAVLMGPSAFSIPDVAVNATVVVIPTYVEPSGEAPSEIMAASRVRIPGWSRLQHVDKFHHTFRVKVEVPSYRSLGAACKVSVCFDQNQLLGLGECENQNWRPLDKGGSWIGTMSPFQEKFVDIRVTNSFSAPPINVSVQDEKSTFRVIFLGVGVIMLVMAPIVSGWVPFYYGTAMTLGILMVVLVILYQAMKFLPTGRKSSLYILLYGSLAGLGTVVVRYFSSLVSAILWEMGFSDDMYSPVAIFTGVAIGLLGAWLGFLGVRKLVITTDGNIDKGVAEFVKWAIRVLGSLCLLQSSSDFLFMTVALIGGWAISWILFNVRVSILDLWENLQDLWVLEPVVVKGMSKNTRKPYMTQAQIDAVRRLPGSESLIISKQGLVNHPVEHATPALRRKMPVRSGELFPSTFHHSPGYRPTSKQEYEQLSKECSNRALDDLMQSKEFAEWKLANRHRVVIEPYEHRQERPVEEIEQTAFLEEAPATGLFGYKRR